MRTVGVAGGDGDGLTFIDDGGGGGWRWGRADVHRRRRRRRWFRLTFLANSSDSFFSFDSSTFAISVPSCGNMAAVPSAVGSGVGLFACC